MVADPAAMPVTTPELFTEAVPDAEELHEPPDVPSVRLTVAPTQTDEAPEIVPALGAAFTVIACVALALPQLFDTV